MADEAELPPPEAWQQEACFTPLHIAAHDKSLHHLIPKLCIQGHSVNERDAWLRTPLHLALQANCSLEILEVLLEMGADVRARNKFNDNVLHYYLSGGCDLNVIKKLLNCCKDMLNDRNDLGDSPINNIFCLCPYEVFRFLVDAGAELSTINREGMTMLHHAAMGRCCKEILDDIIEVNREWVHSVDSDGRIPLHFATQEWVVSTLVKAGSNPRSKDKDEFTPLHYMVQNASTTASAIETLLQSMGPIEMILSEVDKHGDSYLHHAIKPGICTLDVIRALLKAGFNPAQKNNLGNTVLHCAVKACDEEQYDVLKELIRTHAFVVEEKNTDNKNTLEMAEDVDVAKQVIKWVALQDCHLAQRCIFIAFTQEFKSELLLYFEKCKADIQALKSHSVSDNILLYDLVLESYLQSQKESFWKGPFRMQDFDPSFLTVYTAEVRNVQMKVQDTLSFESSESELVNVN